MELQFRISACMPYCLSCYRDNMHFEYKLNKWYTKYTNNCAIYIVLTLVDCIKRLYVIHCCIYRLFNSCLTCVHIVPTHSVCTTPNIVWLIYTVTHASWNLYLFVMIISWYIKWDSCILYRNIIVVIGPFWLHNILVISL